VEIDSLRSKLIEEELAHNKLQDQFLVEKLKRAHIPNANNDDIKIDSQEIIKGRLNLVVLFARVRMSSLKISRRNSTTNVRRSSAPTTN
jgi:hypothetical protein